ncbi:MULTISPECIES: hypothetical protein [unclassified Bacillus (in: firmicutes)]|uniref:hypothetical protein n=1 Tax=unclassified Bacillus (in: firmicutes) TaxID=185979 RepID=UPI0008E29CDA|nr:MULTISPECIES: hypothetical protein [unclassified Bacillus (in: firmicutes)]SFI57453.1 conserved repeat domain-containing protein [Bacillus sp. 71mf]SFS45701.1 conserved repeat domain-containing protein [Bacillus sp. 103mf]
MVRYCGELENRNKFTLSIQPALWSGSIDKDLAYKQYIPRIEVTLTVCDVKQHSSFSNTVYYGIQDIIALQIEVDNQGEEAVSHICVSHMIRDQLSYVPNTLTSDNGQNEFLFQLVRWRIDNLLPKEKARLVWQVKALRNSISPSLPLRATYTFQHNHQVYGPLQTKEALLIKRNYETY